MSATSSTSSSPAPLVNITGLASGLDTDSIVKAMMAVEKRPQQILQKKQTNYQARDTALLSVISKLTATATAARNIGNPLDWEQVTATSSDPTKASVTAGSASSVGSVSFTVLSLASPDALASFGNVPDVDTTVVAAGSITIGTSAGTTVVSTGGGTLNEIVQAINGQTAVGLKAAAIQVAPGQFKLELSTTNVTETVNTNIAQFAGLGPVWGQVTVASQAKVHVGAPGLGFDVISNSNTFANLLPGVNVTVKQADPTTMLTVTSAPDTQALSAKVQKMVDAFNAAIDEVKAQTAYDPATKIAQPLASMSAVSEARALLSNAIIGSSSTTPALVGIQTTDDGHISFDTSKFAAAFEANPTQVTALFANPLDPTNPGLADRLKTTLANITQTGSGSLWSARKGVESTIAALAKEISDYQSRLDRREADLRRQFAALETT